MHKRLTNYLKDNRDQILENWLTEADVSPPNTADANVASGVIPLSFLNQAFDVVIATIESDTGAPVSEPSIHLGDFLGITMSCQKGCVGARACMELHESGLNAFIHIFDTEWDTEGEFNALDREHSVELINHALSRLFEGEIKTCRYKTFRHDCPFVAHQLSN